MKLRYQMRGLGIGIFVTALLMGVATNKGRPLTDAEIRAKAYELGMVDSDSIRLTDLKGNTPLPQGTVPPEGTQQPGQTTAPEGTQQPGQTAAPQGTQQPGQTTAPEGTQQPGQTAAPQGTHQPGQTADPQAPQKPAPDGGASGEAVTVIIMQGTHSYNVSVQLAEAGLIEDAFKFDSFLCNNGYAEKLRAGTYEIIPGTSEEQIARIITKTK